MTETSSWIGQLTQLKAATQEILEGFPCTERLVHPVNWADLQCTEARCVFTDSREVRMEVLIEEAAPEAHQFQVFIAEKLASAGFHGVLVRTEW